MTAVAIVVVGCLLYSGLSYTNRLLRRIGDTLEAAEIRRKFERK